MNTLPKNPVEDSRQFSIRISIIEDQYYLIQKN